MSDQTFIADPKASDQQIASVLIKNRQQFLNFIAKRLGNMADAEDVLQDFCLRAITRQDQLKNKESMVAWLYALLRSTLADYFRKAGRQGRTKQAYQLEMKTQSASFDESEEFASFCNCMYGLLPLLRPEQADLLQRLDIADGQRKAVAGELGISVGNLAVRLHRARQALRKALLNSCKGCLVAGFDDCS